MNPSERKSNVSKLSEHEILKIAKEALQESGIPYEEKPSAQPLPEKIIDPALFEKATATSAIPSRFPMPETYKKAVQKKARMERFAHTAYIVTLTETGESTIKAITPSCKSESAKSRRRKSIARRLKKAKLKT